MIQLPKFAVNEFRSESTQVLSVQNDNLFWYCDKQLQSHISIPVFWALEEYARKSGPIDILAVRYPFYAVMRSP